MPKTRYSLAEAVKWLFEQDLTPAVDWLVQPPLERIERLRSYQRSCVQAVENLMRAPGLTETLSLYTTFHLGGSP